METQVDGLIRSVSEIHRLLESDHKVILAAIFVVCAGSLAMPVLRAACAAIYPVVRTLARSAWNIMIEKIVEVAIITTLVWFAGVSEVGVAIYLIVRSIFHI